MAVDGRYDGFFDRGGEVGPRFEEVGAVGLREGQGRHFADVGARGEGFGAAG